MKKHHLVRFSINLIFFIRFNKLVSQQRPFYVEKLLFISKIKNMNYLEILKNVLQDKGVDASKISEETSLSDLGLDSLDTVSALMDIEEQLNIEFSTEEFSTAKNVKDVLNLIEKKIK